MEPKDETNIQKLIGAATSVAATRRRKFSGVAEMPAAWSSDDPVSVVVQELLDYAFPNVQFLDVGEFRAVGRTAPDLTHVVNDLRQALDELHLDELLQVLNILDAISAGEFFERLWGLSHS